jgi:CDP-diacylglycerol---serine O-phosphatidyltransferase
MERHGWRAAARVAAPQILTAARLVLGAGALAAAADGRLITAATLITLGTFTDGLDGPLARRLGVATPFGALFDYFADYVCYIVAPWGLARALVPSAPALVMALPFLTGAARYARNGVTVTAAGGAVDELPGLGTVFFAFVLGLCYVVAAPFAAGPVRRQRTPAVLGDTGGNDAGG